MPNRDQLFSLDSRLNNTTDDGALVVHLINKNEIEITLPKSLSNKEEYKTNVKTEYKQNSEYPQGLHCYLELMNDAIDNEKESGIDNYYKIKCDNSKLRDLLTNNINNIFKVEAAAKHLDNCLFIRKELLDEKYTDDGTDNRLYKRNVSKAITQIAPKSIPEQFKNQTTNLPIFIDAAFITGNLNIENKSCDCSKWCAYILSGVVFIFGAFFIGAGIASKFDPYHSLPNIFSNLFIIVGATVCVLALCSAISESCRSDDPDLDASFVSLTP